MHQIIATRPTVPPLLQETSDNYSMDGGAVMPGIDELLELGGLGAVGVLVATILLRPKILGAILVFAVAPFKGSRLYNRYLETLAVIHGVQRPSTPETAVDAVPQDERPTLIK